jgi:ribosomal protein S18 acetylase RimI-like enzyme
MTTQLVRIRPADAGDAPGIARVHVEAWRAAYPGLVPATVLLRLSRLDQARDWRAQIARERHPAAILVAEGPETAPGAAGGGPGRPSAIVGFGSCGRARPGPLPQAGEIFTLYVLPDHQEAGIGRALLAGLFAGLADRGLTSVLVWVLAGNPARFFYEAMGGRRVAEREEPLWRTRLPQIAYGWDDIRLVIRR